MLSNNKTMKRSNTALSPSNSFRYNISRFCSFDCSENLPSRCISFTRSCAKGNGFGFNSLKIPAFFIPCVRFRSVNLSENWVSLWSVEQNCFRVPKKLTLLGGF